MPSWASSWSARARAARRRTPASRAGSITLPATVRSSTRLKNWKIIPTWVRRYRAVLVSLRVSIRCPATVTVPADGLSSPATRFSSVDLPLPDGPITATASPAATCTLTRSSAGTPPAAYRLVTSLQLDQRIHGRTSSSSPSPRLLPPVPGTS